MKYKVFVSVYICLVFVFIAVNEFVFEFSDAARNIVVAVFLLAAFLGRHFLRDR